MLSFYRVGIVFCGRQSPGGHNVIWGLHNALKIHNPNSTLLGFLGKLHFLLEVPFFFPFLFLLLLLLLYKLVCMFVIASDMCFYPPMYIYIWIYIISPDVLFLIHSLWFFQGVWLCKFFILKHRFFRNLCLCCLYVICFVVTLVDIWEYVMCIFSLKKMLVT